MQSFQQKMTRFFTPLWPAEEKVLVFGEGHHDHPDIMLIGEAPGEQEALLHRPFVGKAGKNLDELLEALFPKEETAAAAEIPTVVEPKSAEKPKKAENPPREKKPKGKKKPFCINEECSAFLPEDQRGYKKKTAAASGETAEKAEGEAKSAKKTAKSSTKSTAKKSTKTTAKKTTTKKTKDKE